jgi:transcription-repair coupling factor (superfamily II helicase)
VLVATTVIEVGVDVPNATVMIVEDADRFGLSQLHQLRGRVGRGRRRGLAYLLTDPRSQLAPATAKRLQMIAELDRLGAGFTISQRDMDLRGAGDILGEKQAGHIRLVGAELYRLLLERAIVGLNGGSAEPEWTPELNLGVTGLIPSDYTADPEIRINLYARAARIRELRDIDRFADEIEDRFGQMPPATQNLLQLARIRETARRLGMVRLDAGPRAIALTLQPDRVEPMRRALGCTKEFYWKEDRLVHERTNYDDEPLRATLTLLDQLGSP